MTIPAPTLPRSLARSWATHPGEDGDGAAVRSRRMLRLALACLWLLDAALQFQPYMFTKAFVTTTLAPAARGNPSVVADPMRWASELLVGHPAVFNSGFATIQLAIAVGLLWRRTFKAVLAVSIGWAVGVWWFGEGLGGLLTGASPVTGAPGPVILYAVAALLLWPRSTGKGCSPDADPGLLSRRGAHLIWAILWGALACLFLLPANRAPGALHDAVAGMAAGEPGWVVAADRHLAALIGNGASASVALGIVCYLIAVSVFVPAMTRPGILAAGALGSLIWVAQSFGGILTGQGTDPGSGLLLTVIAASLWPRRPEAGSTAAAPQRASIVTKPRWRRPYSGGLTSVLLGLGCTAAGLGFAFPPASAAASMPGRMAMGPGSITAGQPPVRAAEALAVSVPPPLRRQRPPALSAPVR